ncbi:MAG: hypothetical protein ACE5EC_09610, partial [Phycisphaerae bacterium]
CRNLSDERLLRLRQWGIGPAEVELKNRYLAGRLAKKQKKQLFNQAMETTLRGRSVYPAGLQYAWHTYVDIVMPDLIADSRFFLRQHHVTINGRDCPELAQAGDIPSEEKKRGHWIVRSKKFDPGQYVITSSGWVTLSAAETIDLIETLAIHTGPFSATITVNIVDRPPGDFVTAVNDPETVDQTERNVRITGCVPIVDFRLDRFDPKQYPWMYKRSIRIRYGDSGKWPLAGRIHVRPHDPDEHEHGESGSGEDEHGETGRGQYEDMGWIFLIPGKTRYWAIPETPPFAKATTVDIRILPDPSIAVPHTSARDNQYYGATLERHRIKLPSSKMEKMYRRPWRRR